jgi:glycosyltransferase involved in cell wall biosynthesis
MNPRVAVISYALDRNPSGISQYTRGLLVGLREIGCVPLVLQAGRGEKENGVMPLPGAGLLPGLLTLGQWRIRQAVRKQSLTLVHDPTGTAPLMLCPVKRLITIHDVFPLSFPGHSTALENIIYRFWLPYAVKHVDALITDSLQSKSDIQKFLHVSCEKITVIPLSAAKHFKGLAPLEINQVLTCYGITQPYILYVGSIEPRKNLLRLLAAFSLLCQWSPKFKLVIVGSPNLWKSSPAAQFAEQKGLNDRVYFTGYVPDADLPALYNGADLFCFPSLYEGFGLPVLEAMACGTPVITSNTSSLPEIAGDAALLIDPYNIDAITAAMRRILEDSTLAQDLREKGLARARQFSWEKTAHQTLVVYEKVTGQKLS